jgi:CheY-like chemotaxis protein
LAEDIGGRSCGRKAALRVLVIDDSPGDVRLAQLAFEDGPVPCDFSAAPDGLSGLQRLREMPKAPDLVLLDLNMPNMDGIAVLRTMKSDPTLATIPVVVFTTSSTERDRTASLQNGANAFYTKPTDIDGLFSVVRSLEETWFGLASGSGLC